MCLSLSNRLSNFMLAGLNVCILTKVIIARSRCTLPFLIPIMLFSLFWEINSCFLLSVEELPIWTFRIFIEGFYVHMRDNWNKWKQIRTRIRTQMTPGVLGLVRLSEPWWIDFIRSAWVDNIIWERGFAHLDFFHCILITGYINKLHTVVTLI